ncbi:unnamed protein product [Moneuplotes crassus]|uniref:Uncharacterized protein n=1 Tax=Euplotes crassus TaxID=5936 RepID=A0AAD2D7V7_EUPCR|nr:unnamed protein product [Moneuplotes crassus]
MAMDSNNLYQVYVKWIEYISTAEIRLRWNETGSMNAVQPQYFVYPHEVSAGNINVKCQSGYGIQASDPNSCTEICGDGIVTPSEACDDANTSDNDGCSANCQAIEYNHICVYNSGIPKHECQSCGIFGYQNDAKDSCIPCSRGFRHVPSNPNACTEYCGDGIQTSGEVCDDGNAINGDGCSGDCKAIEYNHICVYDSSAAKDQCTSCGIFAYPNTEKDNCISCSSGFRHLPSRPDTCTEYCSDGIQTSNEMCDDGNTIDGDGCSSDCKTIETNHICVYDSILSKDVCSACLQTEVPNSDKNECVFCKTGYKYKEGTQNKCVNICGDGLIVTGESCDDANTLSSDGCNNQCQIEEYYNCTGEPSVCEIQEVEPSPTVEQVGSAVSSAIGAGMGAQMAVSLVFGQGLSSMWMLINIYQIIQFTGMMTLNFPKIMVTFYSYLGIANFEISYFSEIFLMHIDESKVEGRKPFDYRYENQSIESTNLFLNCSDVLFSLLLFLIFNAIIFMITCVCCTSKCDRKLKKENDCCSRVLSHFGSRFSQIKNEFFFSSIFRIVFEVYLEVTFGSIYNLYDQKFENYVDYYSHVVSIIFLLLFLIITISIPMIFCCIPEKHHIEKGRFKILLEDFKAGKRSLVMDHFLLLIRRLALSSLLIFRWNHGIQQVITFLLICIGIFTWKVIVRPFASNILNFQDLLFEQFLLMILIIYLAFIKPTSELRTRGFFHMCGVVCIILILCMVLVNFIVSIILTCKRFCSKKSKTIKIKVKPRSKPQKEPKCKLSNNNLERSKIRNDSRVSNTKLVRTPNSRSIRSSAVSKLKKTSNRYIMNEGPSMFYPYSRRRSNRNSDNKITNPTLLTFN